MDDSNIILPFFNRATYIAWRSEWRETYKDLSLSIRTLKVAIRDIQKSGNYAGNIQGNLEIQRSKARKMMEERVATKSLAKALREASIANFSTAA